MLLRSFFCVAVLCTSLVPVACTNEAGTPGDARQSEDAGLLETEAQRLSYSAGVRFGTFLEYGGELVDRDALLRGLADALDGVDLAMSEAEVDTAFMELQGRMSKSREDAMSAEGKAFLEENAKKEGVVQLPSGLQYKVLEKGAGSTPSATDTVTTHYSGTLLDGTEFDSSYKRGEPTSFGVGRVIPGWTEALQLMQVGDKWELYIPADLAYGSRGAPPMIPPYATLIFQIELISIDEK